MTKKELNNIIKKFEIDNFGEVITKQRFDSVLSDLNNGKINDLYFEEGYENFLPLYVHLTYLYGARKAIQDITIEILKNYTEEVPEDWVMGDLEIYNALCDAEENPLINL